MCPETYPFTDPGVVLQDCFTKLRCKQAWKSCLLWITISCPSLFASLWPHPQWTNFQLCRNPLTRHIAGWIMAKSFARLTRLFRLFHSLILLGYFFIFFSCFKCGFVVVGDINQGVNWQGGKQSRFSKNVIFINRKFLIIYKNRCIIQP